MTLYKWWGKNNDTCQIYEQWKWEIKQNTESSFEYWGCSFPLTIESGIGGKYCVFFISTRFAFLVNCLCILWFKKSKLESHLSKCSLKSWRLWGKFVQREAGFFIKFWRFWPEREQLDNYPHAFFNRWNGIALTKSWLRPSVGSSHFYPAVPLCEILQFFLHKFYL